MSAPNQPRIQILNRADYRESYANSVQVRSSLWDFFLMFGMLNQSAQDVLTIENIQGVFLSPPQAKALFNLLQHNIRQYEAAFGEIRLEANQSGDVVQ